MVNLSVIIVNFNTKELLVKCLDSIFNRDHDISFEVIVIDNGSTDSSVDFLTNYKPLNINHFQLIKNQLNLGYAKANNQGIKASQGKYILLVNSDTIVKKNSLKSLVDFAESNKDAGVVGSRLINLDGSPQASCFHFPTFKNAILEYWFAKKGLFEKYIPQTNKPSEVDAVVGAGFLISQNAVRKIGLLDERYFAYFEDIDYCRRIWANGLKVYYLPESEIVHHHGASFEKIAGRAKAQKMLVASSKKYHGLFKYYLLTFILWLGQKWRKYLKN